MLKECIENIYVSTFRHVDKV